MREQLAAYLECRAIPGKVFFCLKGGRDKVIDYVYVLLKLTLKLRIQKSITKFSF